MNKSIRHNGGYFFKTMEKEHITNSGGKVERVWTNTSSAANSAYMVTIYGAYGSRIGRTDLYNALCNID